MSAPTYRSSLTQPEQMKSKAQMVIAVCCACVSLALVFGRWIGKPYDFAACDPDFTLLGCGCAGPASLTRNCMGCVAGVSVLAGYLWADLELPAWHFPYRQWTFFSCGDGDDDHCGRVRDDWDCEFCPIQIRDVRRIGGNVVPADGDISVGLLPREHSAGDFGAMNPPLPAYLRLWRS
jgi:hypothetical protein